LLDMNGEIDIAAAAGEEPVAQRAEIAGHQREEIGWLGKWIMPFGVVPAIRKGTGASWIAVGKQQRGLAQRGLDPDRIERKHIWTIEEVGDAAKPLRLALRAVIAPAPVEARQCLVGGRIEFGLDPEGEGVRQVP